MEIQIKIDTGNDAFHPDPGPEVMRLLNRSLELCRTNLFDMANYIGGSTHEYPLIDFNGNRVGEFKLVLEQENWNG